MEEDYSQSLNVYFLSRSSLLGQVPQIRSQVLINLIMYSTHLFSEGADSSFLAPWPKRKNS